MAEDNTIRKTRKTRKGVVVSKSGNKSVVVNIVRRQRHPVYGKVIKIAKKFHAHDEENSAQVGDEVTIAETRPLSATKCWRVVKKAEEK